MTTRAISSLVLFSWRNPFLDDSKVYCVMANPYLKSSFAQQCPQIEAPLDDDEYDLSDPLSCEPFDEIGISIMTPRRREALALATVIKQRWPHKIVVAGGLCRRYPPASHLTKWADQDRFFEPARAATPLVEVGGAS